jgi:hypothetical protein
VNHHKSLSPSSFPALLQCGFYLSGDRVGKSDSGFRDKGTALHLAVETAVADALGLQVPSEKPDMKILDVLEIEHAQWAAVEVMNIFKLHYPQYRAEDVQIEPELHLCDDGGNEITFGHEDFVINDVMIDLKSGLDFSTDHYYRPQMAAYALAIMRKTGAREITVWEVYICPRKTVSYMLTYAEASAIVEAVITNKRNAIIGLGDRRINESCRYCGALLQCPAINHKLGLIEDFKSVSELNPDTKSPEYMSKALLFARVIMKPLIERIEAAAMALSDAEIPIPGFKRTTGRPSKSIGDKVTAYLDGQKVCREDTQEDCEIKIAEIHGNDILDSDGRLRFTQDVEIAWQKSGLDAVDFLKCCKVRLPELGKAYAKKTGMAQKNARMEIEGILNEVIETSTPNPRLERE